MKDHWRTKKDGSKVKVDSRPENSYDDGYNAGRRWANKHTKLSMVVYIFLSGLIMGYCLALLGV